MSHRDAAAEARALLQERGLMSAPPVAAATNGKLATAEPPKPFVARRLGEWLKQPALLQPPVALVNSMLWAGRSTMLAGLPKAGKSTLAAMIAAALSSGGELFGQRLGAAPALWLALDEHVGDAVRRLHNFGADPDSLFVTDERPPSVESLGNCIRDIGAKLVVVDTATRWWMGRVMKSNDAEDVRGFLAPYLTMLRETDVALLMLHHTSKAGVRASGSVALEAEVDAPLVLVHPAQRRMLHADGDDDGNELVADDGRRIVQGTSRFTPHIRLALNHDGERFSLDRGTESRRSQVLRAAAREHGPFSKSELVTVAGGRKQATLALVDELRADGLLTESRGRYSISPRGRIEIGATSDDVDEPL